MGFIEAHSSIRAENLYAWFELPINEYEFMGKLGVETDSDDYRITEKELPFADGCGGRYHDGQAERHVPDVL